MKNLVYIFSLLFSLTTQAAPAEIEVDVTNVQDPLVVCDCKTPMNIGRICIRQTRFKNKAGDYYPPEYFTRFDAHVEAAPDTTNTKELVNGYDFVLTSTAYYHQCTFDVPAITYVNEFYIKNFLEPEFYTTKMFDSPSVKGKTPQMRAAVLRDINSPVGYSAPIDGEFGEEKFHFVKGGIQEFYRVNYPGVVAFKTPLRNLLLNPELNALLDYGYEYTRYAKAWLIIKTVQDKAASFGDFTIKLRFYRKAGAGPSRDLSNMGIEIIE